MVKMKFSLDSDIAEIATNLGDVAQEFAGKTVLLTGAGGFLGRYFTDLFSYLNERVLTQPCNVFGYDNLITSNTGDAEFRDRTNVTLVKHDVIHPIVWNKPLHFIIHAAGIASPFYYRAYPLETLDVAIAGTRNMLQIATACHARMAFFSSSEIYGNPDPQHVPRCVPDRP